MTMGESPTYKEVLKNYRGLFIGVLMMPVVGMAIGMILIVWRAPENVLILIFVIFILMFQYLFLVYWIIKKMDIVIKS